MLTYYSEIFSKACGEYLCIYIVHSFRMASVYGKFLPCCAPYCSYQVGVTEDFDYVEWSWGMRSCHEDRYKAFQVLPLISWALLRSLSLVHMGRSFS